MIDIYMRNLKDFVVNPILSCFKNQTFSPNWITIMSGIIGLIGVYFSAIDERIWALVFFWVGRIADGMDGAYARLTNQTSDFGGYLDILVDFTIYGTVPLGVAIAHPSTGAFVALVLLEVTFFVNAAGLFFLSALIEKNENAKKKYESKGKKEVTTLRMPPALIEGSESLILFTLIILFCEY